MIKLLFSRDNFPLTVVAALIVWAWISFLSVAFS